MTESTRYFLLYMLYILSEKRKVKSEKSKCLVVMQNFVGNCCRKTARIMFCRICHKLSEERRVNNSYAL